MVYKYTIPDIPPSYNKFNGRNNNWDYRNQKKAWTRLIGLCCRNKPKQPLCKATVRLTYYFKTRIRHDPDNYSGKFILDGLVNAGIITDDSFNNITLLLSGDYDKSNPRTEIEVTSDA